ncbi:hypothetical protein AL714_06340 [Clostridium botulinum]|uniref:Uncharacterized protein n=2 Tax=Clostridium botulinum TaxID=1491 RepID=A7GBV4_CLOBL|nr:hypothetical protein CLB_0952 [Clostridium botulinum A str. ATCC 19397]ABS38134.1 hypothetical protein CLC_0966 [Clostridium botulinum A str. Hall]ABS42024.1 hypothetical protein CLI_0998 [Clostridium botulinum F str. Langeland]ACQ55056.1 hypothetical protein CLJ_B0961 [Clostridium botulinum Ba4 str. 657]ADF98738.1 hypothetical protein CBF_0971 [Clostridium botulinum F str. 230613]EDT85937.1 hypothetical protein CBB_1119 [Clostridium botulinum Bf]KKM39990.1 hypothetical protein VT72_16935 
MIHPNLSLPLFKEWFMKDLSSITVAGAAVAFTTFPFHLLCKGT